MLLFTLQNDTFDGKGEINVALFFDCTLVCPKYIYIYKKNSTRYKLAKTKWSVGAEPPKWWIIDGHKHALNFCIFLCVNLANIHSWWCVRV